MRIDLSTHISLGGRLSTLKKSVLILVFASMIFGLGGLAGAYAFYSGLRPGTIKEWPSRQYNSVRSELFPPEHTKIALDIEFDAFEKIRAKRDAAISAGVLVSSDDDLVPATLVVNGESLDAKVRLKGDWLDHLLSDKWSFRVEMSGDDRAFGMRRFSVQNPKVRNYHLEQGFLENLRYEGILAPRYEFVEMSLNGENLGIYAVEESFGKEMIESLGRRPGVLAAYDEQFYWDQVNRPPVGVQGIDLMAPSHTSLHAFVNIFDEGRVSKKPELLSQANLLKAKLHEYQQRNLEPIDIFDLEKIATFLAVTELWSAAHALTENNLRLYYNPVSGLIEPVGYDGDPTFGGWGFPSVFVVETGMDLARSLLADPETFSLFMRELERVSQPEYLAEINAELGPKAAMSLDSLQVEYSGLTEVWSPLAKRQAILQKVYSPVLTGVAYAWPISEGSSPPSLSLNIANPLALPVEILGVRVTPPETAGSDGTSLVPIDVDHGTTSQEDWILAPRFTFGESLEFSRVDLELPEEALPLIKSGGSISLRSTVLGQDVVRLSPVSIIPRFLDGAGLSRVSPSIEEVLELHTYLTLESDKTLVIEPGDYSVTTDLIVPEGYTLTINPGVTIRFGTGIVIATTSPIHLHGTEDSPVILEPSNTSWGGVFVQRAEGNSIWQHAIIRDTTGISLPGQTITGAVTFNESSLTLRNVVFDGSQAEDALNVILAGIDFENVTFTRNVSDGFDGDSVVGRIDQGSFFNILGDGVDLSASDVEGRDLVFIGIGDKAISVGEASTARFSNITVDGAGFGIVSKDLSQVDVDGADLKNIIHFPLASYQKKPEYGPAALNAANIDTGSGVTQFVLDEFSELRIERRKMISTEQDLTDLYIAVDLVK
jgi:hypothetical protein